ncbi:MAG: hypothetical protein Q4G36_06555 [Paracoccus sp. (in: a-proteobacteria)]|nr:hypothetical protein [Paracoccus sp. (in: a-proteobacteria)]
MPRSLSTDRPLFLERAAYRRRRLRDAARVLPVLAMLAVLLPVMWSARAMSFASGAIWFFSIWLIVIVATGLLHGILSRGARSEPPDEL